MNRGLCTKDEDFSQQVQQHSPHLNLFKAQKILKKIFPISVFIVFDVLDLSVRLYAAHHNCWVVVREIPASQVTSASAAMIIDGGIDPDQQLKRSCLKLILPSFIVRS